VSGSSIDQLASSFFAAIESGDLKTVHEIYAPSVGVWHNVTGKTQTRDENLRLLEFWTRQVTDLKYEILAREFFPGGFLQRHIVHGAVASGERIEASVCVVVYVSDGKIVKLFEYLDAKAVEAAFTQASVR
jgi:ketosteroid isomerase-like protein